jgi:phage terminase small subunit
MANRGRKSDPAPLKLLKGNPGKREIPQEPAFSTGELIAPSWMKGPALEEWNRIVPELSKLGLARNVSYSNLVGLCRHYACAIRAMKKSDIVQERNSWEAYRKASNEFGLTPATAGKAGAAGKNQNNAPNGFEALG